MKKMTRSVFLVLLACLWAGPTGSAQITLTGLPAPSHGNLQYIGYAWATSINGDHSAEVGLYTNLVIASPITVWDSNEPDWQTPFHAQLQNAVSDGKSIHLLMARGTNGSREFSWDAVLDVADEFWSSVVFVEIFHEAGAISQQDLETEIADLREDFGDHSLEDRPISAEWADMSQTGAWDAEGLDIITLACYLPNDNYGSTSAAIDALNDLLDNYLGLVGSFGKKAFIIMQSYVTDPFDNIEMLTAMQEIYYIRAAADENVIGLEMFAYNRSGGALDHPELIYPHQRIAWAAGLSGHPPGCTPGYGNCLGVEQWREGDGYIQSKSGQYRMVYQASDGNLVVYDVLNSMAVIWASYVFHSPGYIQMQADGNLVIYNAGSTPVLWSGTSGSGTYLYLDDTGNISVVLPNLSVAWHRGTLGCGGYGCAP